MSQLGNHARQFADCWRLWDLDQTSLLHVLVYIIAASVLLLIAYSHRYSWENGKSPPQLRPHGFSHILWCRSRRTWRRAGRTTRYVSLSHSSHASFVPQPAKGGKEGKITINGWLLPTKGGEISMQSGRSVVWLSSVCMKIGLTRSQEECHEQQGDADCWRWPLHSSSHCLEEETF
jgi:hypothetical protein